MSPQKSIDLDVSDPGQVVIGNHGVNRRHKYKGASMEELTKTQFRNQFLVKADVSHIRKVLVKYLEVHGYTVYCYLGRLFLLDNDGEFYTNV